MFTTPNSIGSRTLQKRNIFFDCLKGGDSCIGVHFSPFRITPDAFLVRICHVENALFSDGAAHGCSMATPRHASRTGNGPVRLSVVLRAGRRSRRWRWGASASSTRRILWTTGATASDDGRNASRRCSSARHLSAAIRSGSGKSPATSGVLLKVLRQRWRFQGYVLPQAGVQGQTRFPTPQQTPHQGMEAAHFQGRFGLWVFLGIIYAFVIARLVCIRSACSSSQTEPLSRLFNAGESVNVVRSH